MTASVVWPAVAASAVRSNENRRVYRLLSAVDRSTLTEFTGTGASPLELYVKFEYRLSPRTMPFWLVPPAMRVSRVVLMLAARAADGTTSDATTAAAPTNANPSKRRRVAIDVPMIMALPFLPSLRRANDTRP